MEKLISDFFASENIKYYASQSTESCPLLYPKKLPEFAKSTVFFVIPYLVHDKMLVRDTQERNISIYAVPRDYHLYIKELSARFALLAEKAFPSLEYRFFADNSPFCERTSAEMCGLGKKGKNGLLINPEYGSFFFIGSICFSHNISITQNTENFKCDLCENCEKCKTACPMTAKNLPECLSAITQKKKITEDEEKIIASYKIKWGCDICQNVCPYNKNASETPIEFLKVQRTPYLTPELVANMPDDEFSSRAYSWRGREVIKRNLTL